MNQPQNPSGTVPPVLADWDKLRIFHIVAEAGSFTRAGDLLNLSQSAVSRQIGALEQSLKTPLFHRHARGLSLTEQGEILLAATRDIYNKLALTQSRLADSRESSAGTLRIATTVTFGTCWLAPRLPLFRKLFPDIHISLMVNDFEVDLAFDQADLAIRMVPPKQGGLIRRHLFNNHFNIYASESYIERRGLPENPADLKNHDLILYQIHLPQPVPFLHYLAELAGLDAATHPAPLRGNNMLTVAAAVEAGVGLAIMPDYLAASLKNLRRVFPTIDGPITECHLVYPEELRKSRRIADFRDFLLAELAASKLD